MERLGKSGATQPLTTYIKVWKHAQLGLNPND